ncbi:hypothetical protein [Spirosoma aerophilum]
MWNAEYPHIVTIIDVDIRQEHRFTHAEYGEALALYFEVLTVGQLGVEMNSPTPTADRSFILL